MFLRLLLSALFVLHGVSFSMIVRYKSEDHKQRVESSVRGYMASQEIIEEKKRWQSLPKEEQGLYKLIRLYEKQDNPKFVTRYLKNQDVPIFLVVIAGNQKMYGIDPYTEWFYKNPDKQTFTADQEIAKRGRSFAESIKRKYPDTYKGAIDISLHSSVIFGKDEDIVYEFGKMDKLLQGYNLNIHQINSRAISCAIKYHFVKNNALELLLQREKQLSASWMNDEDRCVSGYSLLRVAAKNKEVFELVAHKDPYNSNIMLYSRFFKMMTHLDRMKNEDSNIFDQEHIDIFVRQGGMSAVEVERMDQVDRILQGKITEEELFIKNVWEQIISNSNSDHSNKYLESQIILSDVQEREEAVRSMNERLMMMAGLMNPIFGDFDID
jgi:hypothetical protein